MTTITSDQLAQLVQQLSNSTQAIQQYITHQINNPPAAPAAPTAPTAAVASNRSVIARPEPFKNGAGDARRFLNYFILWARAQSTPLNTAGVADQEHWIQAALSLLQGEAAVWAVPYLQALEKHITTSAQQANNTSGTPITVAPYPFGGHWDSFVAAFKARFQAADDSQQAQRELEGIFQGGKTAPEYAARFQEIAARTGFSDVDLMNRFRRGLNKDTRQHLAVASLVKEVTTLDELVALTTECDFKMRSYTSEGRRSNNYTNYSPPTATHDPYAMEIDANRTSPDNGRTIEEYRAAMKGKCYGCGGLGHNKAAGNHGSLRCAYCSRMGHMDTVCQDRWMGRAKGRGANTHRAASTSQTPFTLFPEAPTPAAPTAPASIATTSNPAVEMARIQAAMDEQNRILSLLTSNAPQSF